MSTEGEKKPEEGQPDEADTAGWKAEAEKWKEQATQAEQAAKENAGAAEALEQLEGKATQAQAEAAKKLEEAKADTAEQIEQAKAEGERSAADWQAEAEKWKGLSRKHEDRAKENAAAATRLEQLEAEKVAGDKATAEATAQAEQAATAAEARALQLEIAAEYQLPTELAQFLTCDDRKALEEQADKLVNTIGQSKPDDQGSDDGRTEEEQQKAKESEELAELKQRTAAAEAKALRFEIAAEKGLPSQLAEFLTAQGRDDLEKQADLLMAAAGGPSGGDAATRARMPTRDLRPGSMPEGGFEPEPDPAALADKIRRAERGF